MYRNFNSIKVRLEHGLQNLNIIFISHFNSIKVRLELKSSFGTMQGSTTFQFHKGTIRTQLSQVTDLSASISIP